MFEVKLRFGCPNHRVDSNVARNFDLNLQRVDISAFRLGIFQCEVDLDYDIPRDIIKVCENISMIMLKALLETTAICLGFPLWSVVAGFLILFEAANFLLFS
ncbi:uncharacterized protein [Henckelia pumila]|uniref:uncharacterized protein isoform X1 n=1 Tax=Henckelia pumila TaxID=405737 RepID=UPI003C6E55F5